MRLTTYTDYALRTLIHLAANRDRLVTIQDIAAVHGIAKNHLTKVVHQLGLLGVIETVRGRNGGIKLGKEPAQINIGAVVRSTERDFFMAECFDKNRNECLYSPSCMLKDVLVSATAAYLQVLDGVTLDHIIKKSGVRGGNGGAPKPVRFRAQAKTKK
ncbi:MAG: RrF2 family transcriptional regulator [Polaromonas sp.]